MHDFTYPVTSAAWATNGQTFIIGAHDVDRAISIWDATNGEQVYSWNFAKDGQYRVHDLAVTPDGTRLVVLMQHNILIFDLDTREKLAEWNMTEVVQRETKTKLTDLTSVSVSRDSRHILVSMNPADIRLIDISTGETIRRFKGQHQEKYMIRSAFGGADDNFVISGDEGLTVLFHLKGYCLTILSSESKIYIWRNTGPHAVAQRVETLEGHQTPGCVNTVAWHPTRNDMFASAGDDHKVRMYVRISIVTESHADILADGPGRHRKPDRFSVAPTVSEDNRPDLPATHLVIHLNGSGLPILFVLEHFQAPRSYLLLLTPAPSSCPSCPRRWAFRVHRPVMGL